MVCIARSRRFRSPRPPVLGDPAQLPVSRVKFLPAAHCDTPTPCGLQTGTSGPAAAGVRRVVATRCRTCLQAGESCPSAWIGRRTERAAGENVGCHVPVRDKTMTRESHKRRYHEMLCVSMWHLQSGVPHLVQGTSCKDALRSEAKAIRCKHPRGMLQGWTLLIRAMLGRTNHASKAVGLRLQHALSLA